MDTKERQEALGLSQARLAQRVTQPPYAQMGAQEGHASTAKLPKLAELFHCRIDEMFGGRPGERTKLDAREGGVHRG